jgi:eukaryotic-like serine/threonine-protein kinase
MSLAHPPQPGARVGGKYRLVKQLAVGGMGEVWLAGNEATGAHVAVKLCAGNVTAREEAASRFRQEARLGAMLSHRSIVRIFDLVEEPDGALILVMELLRGETLERYLQTHAPLSTKEAVAILLPVLSALGHAHDLGIVHRDLSPANVFLAVDPDGQVIPKLVDFGIAKLPASGVQTLEGRVLGTPRYMSPEQIRSQGDLDGRSDLFSVGVVLYEMLTGTSPFAATSPSASLAAVLETVVDPDPRIEPALWLVLKRAMAKRPYERPRNAHEMAQALATASGDTEANLAHHLRRSAPPRQDAGTGVLPGQLARSMGGQSFGHTGTFFSRRAALSPWLLAGALAATLAVVAMAAVRHGRNAAAVSAAVPGSMTAEPPPAAPSTRPPPHASEHPIPSSSASALASPPAASALVSPPPSAPETPPASATSTQLRSTHTRRARPIATTPGF